MGQIRAGQYPDRNEVYRSTVPYLMGQSNYFERKRSRSIPIQSNEMQHVGEAWVSKHGRKFKGKHDKTCITFVPDNVLLCGLFLMVICTLSCCKAVCFMFYDFTKLSEGQRSARDIADRFITPLSFFRITKRLEKNFQSKDLGHS